MVPQEQRPLARVGNRGGLLDNVDDGEAIFAPNGHEQPGHEREVESHVAFIAVAEVGDGVVRPLIGLGQEQTVLILPIDVASQLLQESMGLGQVLAGGSLALVKVGDRVQPEAVDP